MPPWQAAECLWSLQAKSLAFTLQQSRKEMQGHLALPVSRRKWTLVGRFDQEAKRAEQRRAHCCSVQAAAACVAGRDGVAEREHTVQCFLPHAWSLIC